MYGDNTTFIIIYGGSVHKRSYVFTPSDPNFFLLGKRKKKKKSKWILTPLQH